MITMYNNNNTRASHKKLAFIFRNIRFSKFLGCIPHCRGFKIFPVSLNTCSIGADVAGTENTLFASSAIWGWSTTQTKLLSITII